MSASTTPRAVAWGRFLTAVAVLATAVALFLPAVAPATTLSRSSLGPFDRWTLTAEPSDTNNITVGESGTRFVVTDNHAIVLGTVDPPCFMDPTCGCTGLGSTTVSCTKANAITVLAGNGNRPGHRVGRPPSDAARR